MRQSYLERSARPELGSRIACIWMATVQPRSEPDSRVLPDGCVDIIWAPGHEPWVAGPDTSPKLSSVPPGTLLVGVRFLPGAAAPLFQVPISSLTNLSMPLADLWPHQHSREVRSRLDCADSIEQAAAALEDAVAKCIQDSAQPDPLVQRVIANILLRVSGGSDENQMRHDDLGITPRQLRNRFRDAIGYGPKAFERIARFRRFLHLTRQRPGLGLAGLAAEAGYADQPHLTRECMKLGGRSPRILAASVEPISDLFKTLDAGEFRMAG